MPLVLAVFVAGAVWSFREQTALAAAAGFHVPQLLPLTIDGFAIAMAAVAWAASLDARVAVFARTGVAAGIACSSAVNAAWAWQRSTGDPLTVIVAAGVPLLAMLAFEVLLAEVRRQVQRRRGLPRPVPVPWPRMIRLVLAPVSTVRVWRSLVLEHTDPRHQFAASITEGTTAWKPQTETEAETGRGSGSLSASSWGTAEQPGTAGAGSATAPHSRTTRQGSKPRSRTKSAKTTGSSRTLDDTELISQILANGWTSESQNSLSSLLKVGKPRAGRLHRAAQQQLDQNSNPEPSPVPAATSAPVSNGKPSNPETATSAVLAQT